MFFRLRRNFPDMEIIMERWKKGDDNFPNSFIHRVSIIILYYPPPCVAWTVFVPEETYINSVLTNAISVPRMPRPVHLVSTKSTLCFLRTCEFIYQPYSDYSSFSHLPFDIWNILSLDRILLNYLTRMTIINFYSILFKVDTLHFGNDCSVYVTHLRKISR